MRTGKLLLGLVATLLVCAVFVSRGYASGPVYVTNQSVPVTVLNYQQIQSLVVNALRELSSQDTANITDLGKLETNLADVQNKAHVQYGVEAARLAAINSVTSGANDCNFLMGNSAFSGYAAQAAQLREQLISQNLDWVSNAPTINGQPNPSAVSSTAAYSRLDAATCAEGIASASVIEAGGCGNNKTPGPNAGLATNAGELLQPTAMSPTESVAAQIFLNRAATPQPLPPLKPVDVTSGDAGSIIASRDALLGRLGDVDWVLGGVIARRQPWTQGPPKLTQWANGSAAQMNGAIPKTNGTYFPYGVSKMDYMRVQADIPMFDQKYIAKTSVALPASNIKALLREVAFGNWLQFQRYKIEEQQAATLALLLSQSQEPTQKIGASR